MMDVMKTEHEIDPFTVQESNDSDIEQKKYMSEVNWKRKNLMNSHVAWIKVECVDPTDELISEIKLEETPVLIPCTLKSEAEILKHWKEVYDNNSKVRAQYTCLVDDYIFYPDGSVDAVLSVLNQRDGQNITISGGLRKWNGHFMYFTSVDNKEWSGPVEVLATDYESYKIMGGCLEVFDKQPMVAMEFLSWTPDNDTLNAAKEALSKTGLDFKDFDLSCPL